MSAQLLIWPECFQTGVVPDDRDNAALCADALTAWANCAAGNAPTEHFGDVLVKIGARLGVTATADNLMKWSDSWLAKEGAP
jgi:hypothetical protein